METRDGRRFLVQFESSAEERGKEKELHGERRHGDYNDYK